VNFTAKVFRLNVRVFVIKINSFLNIFSYYADKLQNLTVN